VSLKSFFRGWTGEQRGVLAQIFFLDHRVYAPFNNVILATATGTTQIDHVVVSRHGIFVVEAKNWRGLIQGNETDPEWTQVLGRKRYKQQNPLHQNCRHMQAVVEVLGGEAHMVIPVIMLWGRCRVEGRLPPNVITSGYTDFIKRHTLVLFEDDEVKRLAGVLRQRMLSRTPSVRQAHVAHVKARVAGKRVCPRCGGGLRLLTAQTGARAGTRFYGCVRYPVCKYTRDAGAGGDC